MYYDPYEEEIEFIEQPDESYFEDSLEIVYYTPGPTPDPILIAGVTLIVGLFLFGFLTRLGGLFFNPTDFPEAIASEAQNDTVASQDNFQSNPETAGLEIQSTDCSVSTRFPDKVTRWCALITQYANKHNLDPDLVAALVWLESGGNELAYSRSGAVGLMQVMPNDGLAASFMCANGPCFKDRPSADQLRDPEFNIAFGTRFLAGLVKRYGNLRDALRSYGPMDAGYTYSDKVLSIFNRYRKD